MSSVIERIAGYACDLRYDEVPDATREWVKRATIDGLACAFLGLTSSPALTVERVVAEMGGREQASMFGRGEKTSLYWAALANGVALRYWDFNDVYFGPAWTAHPSDNVAAVLAAAEYAEASGRDLLTALVTAYEVQMAFSDLPVEQNLWHRGWHHSGACAYSSAAAVSRLLGLNSGAAAHALALAGARTSTLAEIRHGPISMDKALSAPLVAANGLLAAVMAREGYTGCLTLLDGHYGFGMAVAGIADVEALVPTTDEFKSTKVSLKPYPVEGMTITMVEAALEARTRYPGDPSTIDEIVVETYKEALIKPSWDALKIYPDTKETADHSFSFCVALALAIGRVTIRDFSPESLADENVVALIPKVTLRENERFTDLYRRGSRPAAVRVRGAAGTAEAEVLYPKGDPRHPMTDDELTAKFIDGAEPVLGASAHELLSRLFDLEAEQTVAEVAALLANGQRISEWRNR